MREYIYNNILSLACPVGSFSVCNGKRNIPFSIRNNDYNVPYYDISTPNNYALDIDTSLLEIGEKYNVVFSEGGLHFRGCDEHTESITATVDNYSVGIGSFDMNDDFFRTEEEYKGYDVWKAEDNSGFSFVLLDRSVEIITFLVAWIEHSENKEIDHEDALDFWLT